MQYSPKLKKAAEEIKDILKKHDIAAVIMLHTPGYGEYVVELSPSYSCAKIEHGLLSLKSNAADYPGGIDEQRRHISDTANMLEILSDLAEITIPGIVEANEVLRLTVDVTHYDCGHTSHDSQNN